MKHNNKNNKGKSINGKKNNESSVVSEKRYQNMKNAIFDTKESYDDDDFIFEGEEVLDAQYKKVDEEIADNYLEDDDNYEEYESEDEYDDYNSEKDESYYDLEDDYPEDEEDNEYYQEEEYEFEEDIEEDEYEFGDDSDDEYISEYVPTKRRSSEQSYVEAYAKYNDKKHVKREFDILKDYSDNDLPIIEMYRVYMKYQDDVEALSNVNFRVDKGEFVFIVGKSGSGKSTIMKLLLRDIQPTSGRVYVNGRELTRLHRRKIAKFRRSIGVVFQDFKLLRDRTVYENVAFAMRVVEKSQKEIRRTVPEMLNMVGLYDKRNSMPDELSGGEQQRVALARALVNKPAILLADEPTGNLDPNTAWEIMELLEEINRNGTTVIVVTHNVDIVDAMKKRVIAIKKGRVVSDEQKGGYSYED